MTVAGAVLIHVGLGANLGDPRAAIASAIDAFERAEEFDVITVSAIRETEPVGPVVQEAYLNGALAARTRLDPRATLHWLLACERAHGRDRSRETRWGPRTLDLDLLLYGDAVIDEPGITVPHPRLHERLFVLEPLADIAPGLVHPRGLGPITELRDALRRSTRAAGA